MGQAPARVPLSSAQGRWLLFAAVLGSGLSGIDATVVNVALPAIGESFDASFTALQWVVTAYALTLAAFILVGGVLGDRYGRRRVFVVGVVWFAAASLLCGLAPTEEVLVLARALQGVGGALLTPASLAVIQASVTPADRARAIGAWSGLSGVATAVGPFLGGWLVDAVSWRWVFLVNAPLAVVLVVVATRHVPDTRDPTATGGVDWLGAVVGAVALAGTSYALISAGDEGWTLPVVAAGVLGAVAAAAFVVVERRSAHPMLPLSVFSSAQFSAANVVTFIVYGAFGVVFFLLVIQLQVVLGYGPVAAGVALLPVTGLMLLLSAWSGEVAARIGPPLQMALGPVVCAAGLVLMLRVGRDAGYVGDVLPAVLVFGLGLSVLVAPLTATALGAAPDEHAGLASGVNNAVARTGGLVAVAAVPALAGLTGRVYDDPDAFDAGFTTAMWVAVGALLVGAVVAAVSIRDDVLEPEPREEPTHHVRHCGVGAPPLTTSTDARVPGQAAEGSGR
ncbi:MFS transporter [Phycicoccus sp. CSK15P-2]|uniref:MFS transporter n=1 Tax=Phycicoccus sp. CSK15P-2 TaxID=2807627 RepID=UPI0019514341|nr:MFS transporter [Phycicoccus sp. CSK15P-2]MBM6402988.1 MFS transporter [Phycicoccus sp. CSK15P-2]